MYFEILIEDQSGKKALDIIVPKIIGDSHSYKVIAYKGVGHIPRNLTKDSDPSTRILLQQLPRLLMGYGRTFEGYPSDYPAILFVVCDLDRKNLRDFKGELLGVLRSCTSQPPTVFCIAIEEGEAWLLGDIAAIKAAYPNAKDSVLNGYVQDSICGTWETLANAVYRGGASALSEKGWCAVGAEKSRWAEMVCPHLDVEQNNSPSFQYFKKKLVSACQ